MAAETSPNSLGQLIFYEVASVPRAQMNFHPCSLLIHSVSLLLQLGLYLTLKHFDGAENFYSQIVGLRLANQALERVQSVSSDSTEQYRVSGMRRVGLDQSINRLGNRWKNVRTYGESEYPIC